LPISGPHGVTGLFAQPGGAHASVKNLDAWIAMRAAVPNNPP